MEALSKAALNVADVVLRYCFYLFWITIYDDEEAKSVNTIVQVLLSV